MILVLRVQMHWMAVANLDSKVQLFNILCGGENAKIVVQYAAFVNLGEKNLRYMAEKIGLNIKVRFFSDGIGNMLGWIKHNYARNSG